MKVMMEWMRDIKQGTDHTRENVQKSIDDTNKAIGDRLDNAARVIGALQGKLGEMSPDRAGHPPLVRSFGLAQIPRQFWRRNAGKHADPGLAALILPVAV